MKGPPKKHLLSINKLSGRIVGSGQNHRVIKGRSPLLGGYCLIEEAETWASTNITL